MRLKITMTPNATALAKQMGKRAYKQELDKLLGGLSRKINENITEAAPLGKEKRNYKGKVTHTPGGLKKAHRQRKVKQLEYEGFIDARSRAAKYYKAVRFGVPASKINPILPRKKKALWWPGLPHPVKKVTRHPGIKPNDYVTRGINDSNSDIKRIEEKMGVTIEREIIGG